MILASHFSETDNFWHDFYQWLFFLPHDFVIHTLLARVKVKAFLFCFPLQCGHNHPHPWPSPLNTCFRILLQQLFWIFRSSFSTGIVPLVWKHANNLWEVVCLFFETRQSSLLTVDCSRSLEHPEIWRLLTKQFSFSSSFLQEDSPLPCLFFHLSGFSSFDQFLNVDIHRSL